jgi:spore coat polysaccharide biosynthesis predicted glycosyltransferase SpsG
MKKNFGKLLYEHQFILCSGGSTIWEALYLNKKPLVINTSVKQFQNSKNLSKDRFIKLFQRKMSINNIKEFLLNELKSNKTYFKRKKIVDGYGLNRIVKVILDEKKG